MNASQVKVRLHNFDREALASRQADDDSLEVMLEEGGILAFEPGAVPVPSQEDMVFLREELPKRLAFKNISYHPEGKYLTGMKGAGELRRRTKTILHNHHEALVPFLNRCFPHYAAAMRHGKVNFRPLEEKGRKLSVRASNELIHVDAMASGATHGDRIFRFFTNIHPTAVRVWKSAGRFPELYVEFAAVAGIADLDERHLRPGPAKRLFSGALHTLSRAGFPQAEMALDKSPYDAYMRRFHNFLKENEPFQADQGRIATFEFPPFTSWCVYTDMVSHAVIRGRHALVHTFHIRLRDCRRPQLAPYNILAAGGRIAS